MPSNNKRAPPVHEPPEQNPRRWEISTHARSPLNLNLNLNPNLNLNLNLNLNRTTPSKSHITSSPSRNSQKPLTQRCVGLFPVTTPRRRPLVHQPVSHDPSIHLFSLISSARHPATKRRALDPVPYIMLPIQDRPKWACHADKRLEEARLGAVAGFWGGGFACACKGQGSGGGCYWGAWREGCEASRAAWLQAVGCFFFPGRFGWYWIVSF